MKGIQSNEKSKKRFIGDAFGFSMKFKNRHSKVLTRLELSISIQYTAFPFFNRFKIILVLLGLSQFAKKTEFSIEITGLHTLLKLRQGNTFLDFCHVLVLGDPFVGEVLRWLGPLNDCVRLLIASG